MIVDGLLNLFHSILAPIVGILPTGTFPIDDNAGQGLRQWLFRLDYLVPFVDPLLWLSTVVASSAFVFLAYRMGVFLYNKVRGS